MIVCFHTRTRLLDVLLDIVLLACVELSCSRRIYRTQNFTCFLLVCCLQFFLPLSCTFLFSSLNLSRVVDCEAKVVTNAIAASASFLLRFLRWGGRRPLAPVLFS